MGNYRTSFRWRRFSGCYIKRLFAKLQAKGIAEAADRAAKETSIYGYAKQWETTENEISEQEQVDPNWAKKVKFTAVIEERQRLARELHDAVSQQLFAISMTATAVSRTIERDWERAKRQVQLIEEMAAVAQSEMRALLLHLRPVHLDGKIWGRRLLF